MGLFEMIFGRKERQAGRAADAGSFQLLEGYTPVFRTWQGSIYESELIRAALDAHGRHAAKLQPVIQGGAHPELRRKLQIAPNDFQTWPKFLYRIAQTLYVRNTAFIAPVIGQHDETIGIMGIAPDSWELVTYNGKVYIRFMFTDGKQSAVELNRVGIVTRYQYRNELFGDDNSAMKATLELIDAQRTGIIEGIKNAASYRFSAQSDNWSTDEDLASEAERFSRINFRQKKGGGMLLFPNSYKNIQHLKQDGYKVDAEQMKLIKDNVYDYFAINEDVIQNKSFGDNWLAFYEGAVEWLAIQLSEEISRMLYSDRERQYGNRVFFTSNRLQYMSNADKLNAVSQMADRGLMTRNELREIMNLSPLPEPLGSQIPARGEYYNVNEAGRIRRRI